MLSTAFTFLSDCLYGFRYISMPRNKSILHTPSQDLEAKCGTLFVEVKDTSTQCIEGTFNHRADANLRLLPKKTNARLSVPVREIYADAKLRDFDLVCHHVRQWSSSASCRPTRQFSFHMLPLCLMTTTWTRAQVRPRRLMHHPNLQSHPMTQWRACTMA